MENSKEIMVKESLSNFLTEYSEQSQISAIDDILLNYLVSCLEDVNTDTDSSDTFDVTDFTEMMEAYLPGFENISSVAIHDWVITLAAKLQEQEKNNTGDTKVNPVEIATVFIPKDLTTNGYRPKERYRSCSSSSSNTDDGHSRMRTLSINSNHDQENGATGACVMEDSYAEESIKLLLEMFPAACSMEATHCLQLVNGDLEKAAQVMLHRQETDESLKDPPNQQQSTPIGRKTKTSDKEMKDCILAKYSYIDLDDDKREHKPSIPKKFQGQKKMVRYLDGQVVNTKGERFTEIKAKEDEEMKKTYVNLKPAKQYRFH